MIPKNIFKYFVVGTTETSDIRIIMTLLSEKGWSVFLEKGQVFGATSEHLLGTKRMFLFRGLGTTGSAMIIFIV